MSTFLIVPGAPFFLLALAGALLAALGLVLRPPRPLLALSAGELPHRASRVVIGQAAGASVAALCILTALASNATGTTQLLLLALALTGYLGLGVVLPRRPQAQRERAAADLRRLTPGFIAFVRVALGSFEAPIAVMRRYVERPYPAWAPMQALVAEALQLSLDQRLRPFAALAAAAHPRGCRELTDVAAALAQAEAEGGPIEQVLAAQQQTLELILQGEFRRMLRRRTLYLLLLVAVSLVVGILINLLFVMTGGGAVLTGIG
jgi:hypothetical protein